MDEETALKRVRGAACVGALVGVVTLIASAMSLGESDWALRLGLSPWMACDGVLCLALAFGVLKRSRACAVFLALYFILARIGILIATDAGSKWPVSWGIAALLAMSLLRGAWATFAYHRLHPPELPKRQHWWIWVAVSFVALALVLLVGLGLYVERGWLAEPATAGAQLPKWVVRKMGQVGLLPPGEEILYLYSNGMWRVEEDVSFFTRQRLVLHCEDWETPTYVVELSRIEELTPYFSESILDQTSIEVVLEDGSVATITVGPDAGGDKRFFEALKRAWATARRAGSDESDAGK